MNTAIPSYKSKTILHFRMTWISLLVFIWITYVLAEKAEPRSDKFNDNPQETHGEHNTFCWRAGEAWM